MGLQFVGIDIGTTTICGIIYDPETRDLRAVTKKNPSCLESENDWEDLQDPKIIHKIVQEILDEFLTESDGIKGIGITGQMHGILYVDKEGNSLGPLYTWRDRRGDLIYQDELSYVGFLARTTGYSLATGYGLVTHFYNLKNNLVPDRAHRICTIMDYLVMKLAKNKLPVIDPSNAASFGLYDLESSAFDLQAMKKASIQQDILPEIIPSGQITGYYNKEIFLCNAIGDNQASFLGAVSDFENSVLLNIGTSAQFSVYTNQHVKNEVLELRPFPGGGYLLVGSALSGGSSLVILKNFYYETIKMFISKSMEEIDFYNAINSLKYPGEDSNELQVEVLFRGTRLDPEKRGSITNISVSNFTPVNLVFGFIHGICNELFGFFEKIPDNEKNKIQKIIGSGNAIRMNTLLCRILEDTFSRKITIPQNSEQAAFGACLNAMAGGKYVASYHELGQFISYL
jgi:sedoheptulokinase